MTVHEAITRHTRKMQKHLEIFQELDHDREQAIDRAVELCLAGRPFSVDEINRVTAKINEHAKHGISPTRPRVTPEMVREYDDRLSRSN
ncbi:DUF2533 family protein [Paenibacillus xerothermodurans]|uniref:DUF2533 family protein n=1 Tax=Paenibacillus xerothermodurans TaxID=1977292 RepID=A0A2W1NUU3_PAEXE|nr:DUF2533 family protein [Paenibacillus xerothermodurans]PZE22363.1 DUF2533 family protein [Paenibacillus xerothermodurans]